MAALPVRIFYLVLIVAKLCRYAAQNAEVLHGAKPAAVTGEVGSPSLPSIVSDEEGSESDGGGAERIVSDETSSASYSSGEHYIPQESTECSGRSASSDSGDCVPREASQLPDGEKAYSDDSNEEEDSASPSEEYSSIASSDAVSRA